LTRGGGLWGLPSRKIKGGQLMRRKSSGRRGPFGNAGEKKKGGGPVVRLKESGGLSPFFVSWLVKGWGTRLAGMGKGEGLLNVIKSQRECWPKERQRLNVPQWKSFLFKQNTVLRGGGRGGMLVPEGTRGASRLRSAVSRGNDT